MKVFYIFLLFIVIGVYAQRKAARVEQPAPEVTSQRTGRGRTRFTTEVYEPQSTSKSSIPARRTHLRSRHETIKVDSRTQELAQQADARTHDIARHVTKKPEEVKVEPKKHLPVRPERTRTENRRHDVFAPEPDISKPKTVVGRKETARLVERRPVGRSKRPYEVEETIDDIPNPNVRSSRPRVITETKFEARNAPKTQLFEPAPFTSTESSEELLKNFGSIGTSVGTEPIPKEIKPAAVNDLMDPLLASDENPTAVSAEENDQKKQPDSAGSSTTIASAEKPVAAEERQQLRAREPSIVEQDLKKTNFRSRARLVSGKDEETQAQTPRSRTRGRQARKDENEPSVPSTSSRPVIARTRTIRRQHHEPKSAPSVFPAETDQIPAQARQERRIVSRDHDYDPLVKATSQRHITRTTPTATAKPETTQRSPRSRGGARFQIPESQNENHLVEDKSSNSRSRGRGRSSVNQKTASRNEVIRSSPNRSRGRYSMADIDEAKLEVLPLFETESEAVNVIAKRIDADIQKTNDLLSTSSTDKVVTVTASTPTGTTHKHSSTTTPKASSTKSVRRTNKRVQNSPASSTQRRGTNTNTHTNSNTNINTNTNSNTKTNTSRRSSTPKPIKNHPKSSRRQSVAKTTPTPETSHVKRRQTHKETSPTPVYTTTTKPKLVERRQTKSVETQTTPSIVLRSTPTFRETVKVTESEVVSTKKVVRSQLKKEQQENAILPRSSFVKVDEPTVTVTQVVTRGNAKAQVPKGGKVPLSNSEEDIDEEDNYPEPFKALIQEKKSKTVTKGSRPRPSTVEAVLKSTVKVSSSAPIVSTSSASSSTTPTTQDPSVKLIEEINNELLPTKGTTSKPRPSRKRFSLTTKEPHSTEKPYERSSSTRFDRSTKRPYKNKTDSNNVSMLTEIVTEKSSSSTIIQKQKFHARFNGHRNSTASTKPKGSYSNRKTLKPTKIEPHERNNAFKSVRGLESTYSSTQGPSSPSSVKKPNNRFSARYRGDILSRVATRTTTGYPVYVPTVPTITPSPTSVNRSVEREDNNTLGVHIISFDDTLNNTIQSDNLINGDMSSTTHPSTVVSREAVSISTSSAANNDKQMSIIERIISSITSISTTPLPDTLTKTTTLPSEPTRGSAILKLATKKPAPPELTEQRTKTLTTEKPTTIIERILTSLSAIQAETTTESRPKSTQVGSNFNSISTTTFKPSSTKRSVTKEQTSSTLPAQVTSTLDPIAVLEQIAADETLQKRTIGKLLALLNAVNGPTTSQTILVTPKATSYVQTTQPAKNYVKETTTEPSADPNENTVVPTSTSSETVATTETISTTTTKTTQTVSITQTSAPLESTTTTSTTSSNPKDDVETFVPTTIPVVSTRIQDMLNVLSKLINDMNRSTSTTTEQVEVSTMDPRMLADRLGEINTETPTTKTNSEVTDLNSSTIATEVTKPPSVASTTDSSQPPTTSSMSTMGTATETPSLKTMNPMPSTMNPMQSTTMNPMQSTTMNPVSSTMNSMPSTTTNSMQSTTANAMPSTTMNSMSSTTSGDVQMTPNERENFVSTPFIATTFRYTTTPTFTVTNDVSETRTTTNRYTNNAIVTNEISDTSTPEMTIDTTLNPSTLPTVETFEISPEKVSIFSANDIASTNIDDLFGTTVSILSRNFATTMRSEITTVPARNSSDAKNATSESADSQLANSTSAGMSNDTMSTESVVAETTTSAVPSTSTAEDIESNKIDNTKVDQSNTNNNVSSTTMSPTSSSNNTDTVANVTTESRSGKLLNVVQDPVQNDIQSTPMPRSKDYFIFAILPNNTIVRKRPSMFPTKETPFLIVGYYPNNTIIRKFPNGTLVPEEPVMQVSGFDTRDPLPPLPDITSNQVTQTQGEQVENNVLQTASLPQKIQVETNEVSLTSTSTSTTSSTTTTTTTPSTTITTNIITTTPVPSPSTTRSPLVDILGGKTVEAFNSIVNQTNMDKASVEVEPLTSTKKPDDNGNVDDNVITGSSKPPVTPELSARFGETTPMTMTTTSSVTEAPKTTQPSKMSTNTQSPTTESASTTVPTTTQPPTTKPPTTKPPITKAPTTKAPTTVASPTTIQLPLPTTTVKVPTVTTEVPTTEAPTTKTVTTEVPKTTSPPPTPIRLRVTPTPRSQVPTLRPPVGFSTTFLPMFISTILSTMRPRVQTTTEKTIPPTTVTIPPTTTTPVPTTTTPMATTTTNAPRRRSTVTPTSTFRTTRSTTPVPTTRQVRETTTFGVSTTPEFRPQTVSVLNIADFAPTTTFRPNVRGRSRFQSTTPVQTTITTEIPTTTPFIVTARSVTTTGRPAAPFVLDGLPPKKELTEEQKQNIETLAALEKEQQAILKQLSFLTNLNFGPPKKQNTKPAAPLPEADLANRIVSLAVERNKKGTTTPLPSPSLNLLEALAPSTSRQTKKLVTPSGNQPSVSDILEQLNKYNLENITPSTLTSTYGKSNEAILAALLKEQGLATTPRTLEKKLRPLIEAATTTPRPRTTLRPRTTQPMGRLRQGLNWLLNALAPPPSPAQRSRPKPTSFKSEDFELLNNEPTNITPVVYDNALSGSDRQAAINSINSLSDSEFQKLLKQLQSAKTDPNKLKDVDLSFLRIGNNKNVEVSNLGTSGASTKIIRNPKAVATTATIPVSTNSIGYDDDEIATTKSRVKLPPVKLDSIPGIPDEDNQVRGQLINAAVNVTKAISTFFGSAIQDASQQFFRMFPDSASAQQLAQYLNATLLSTITPKV